MAIGPVRMRQEPVPVTGCWLRVFKGRIEVLLEVDGEWKIVHSERPDPSGESICSAIAEPGAIRKGTPDPVTEAVHGDCN